MMNILYILLAIFLLVTGVLLYARYRKPFYKDIYSYKEVESFIEELPQKALVLFDVDDTLITSPVTLARSNDFPWWFKVLVALRFPSLIRASKREEVYSYVLQAKHMLIEQEPKKLIDDLKKRGVVVVGLSGIESHAYAGIRNMPWWRYSFLKEQDIEFTQTFSDQVFFNFSLYNKGYPMLYKGILCANQQSKGKVLQAFLKSNALKPSLIVSFDNSAWALDSIHTACADMNIPCVLFHYKGAEALVGPWSLRKAFQEIGAYVQIVKQNASHS